MLSLMKNTYLDKFPFSTKRIGLNIFHRIKILQNKEKKML